MTGLTYSQFAEKIIAAGYTPRDCQRLHWQIIGGPRLVNVWAHTANGFTFQVEGMGVVRHSSIEKAIDAADGIYMLGTPNGRPSEKYRRRIKKLLFAAKPECHYCGAKLKDLSVSVLEHNIPLSKGGTSERSNLVLSCIRCDQAKGTKMPHEFMPERVDGAKPQPAEVAAPAPATDRPTLTSDQVKAVINVFAAKCEALQQEIAEHEEAIAVAKSTINAMLGCQHVIRGAEAF